MVRTFAGTWAGLLALAIVTAAGWAWCVFGTPADPDSFAALNSHFRSAYRQARERVRTELDPVILCDGDQLTLIHARRQETVRTTPLSYHQLKAVAHVPFSIFLILEGTSGDLTADQRKQLQELRYAAALVVRDLPQSGLADDQRDFAARLLAAADEQLGILLAGRRVEPPELAAWLAVVRPTIERLVEFAAAAQVQGFHRQMMIWKAHLTPVEWQRLRVVIQGTAMPRKDHLAVQYFARLFNEPGEGRRIVYAEALFEPERALNLLATHELDRRAATAFFADPLRLHRDLLADAARRFLAEFKLD
jgi:hypothetical protein